MAARTTTTGPILLVGAAGQLGTALEPRLARLGQVVRATRAEVDLEQVDQIRALVRRMQPSVVVNAAAYTAVDDAERDEARCARLNAIAPTVLAEETARLAVPLVHFSTNYVFDGTQSAAYTETVPTSPLSVYGATKAEGERGVAGANPRHLIIRTAAVYGGEARNFLRRILELARERDELRIVADQFVSPTPAWALADAAVAAAAVMMHRDAVRYGVAGLYHVTTTGSSSWYQFARRIVELDPNRSAHLVRSVVAISTSDFPTPARRPANGTLDVGLFERTFSYTLPGWEEALRRTFEGANL